MKPLTSLLAFSACAVAFVSCQQQNYYVETSFDAQNKTMNVPTGYDHAFIGPVKQGLKEQGWKLLTYNGTTAEKVSDSKTIAYDGRGRYTLHGAVKQVDTHILTFEPMVNIDISVTDNKTGEEIIGYSAFRTQRKTCVSQFLDLIKKNTH